MNILQILPELNVGGVERGTVDLARYLVKYGHKAVVVSAGGELVKDLESCGAIHYKLPAHKKSIFAIIKIVPRLVEIIKKENIEIVHARSRVPAWVAYFACRRTNAVYISTCHGYYTRHMFSFVMGWAKRVIVLSNVIARHMIDDFKVPYERIRLIPRSVDLEKFKYIRPDTKRKDEFNIGIIGRITPLKGHLYFIKAMARVARIVPKIKIWIVGDAPSSREAYKEQLQVLVRRLGLTHCTEFLGTQRDIPAILVHLDLVVLATTTHEAFGRVVVEAQAAGVPVVATEVGGVVDIIENGKNGLLVPPADPSSMAEAVIKIFKDKELARSMAECAYEKVKKEYNVELMVKNTIEVYKDALSNFKILIIKFGSLGDLILSTAAMRAIREKFFGKYKITFVVGEESKEVLLRSPLIDELVVADLKHNDKGLRGIWRIGERLRKENFDIVIDLQNNHKSHLLSFLTLCVNRYGYKNNKYGFLLNKGIKDDQPAVDPVTHQFRILQPLGIELKNNHLELWPTEEDKRSVDELLSAQWLSANQKLIGINLSASPRWKTKSWPPEYIARLCDLLGPKEIRVVLTGTEKDLPVAKCVMGLVKSAKPINACAKTTVNELACLIKKCAVYICADSSPLHIAAAMDTPFVALFGPTDYRRHLPMAKKSLVLKKDIPCSPCYKPKCKSGKCMESITPEEVLQAVERFI
jgi:lipopolysaccharide heptosyltransferase II